MDALNLNSNAGLFGRRFRCTQCADPKECDASPCCGSNECPEQIPQPRFPSPNTALSPQELEELRVCMEEVNGLLQALGNPFNEQNQRSLQMKLQELRGSFVVARAKCGGEERTVSGSLAAVGRDFIAVDDFEKKSIIPFHHLQTVEHDDTKAEHMKQEFISAETCLRRELILHFSEVVSKSPFLVNVFFGLSLSLYLSSLLNKKIVLFFEKNNRVEKAGGTLTHLSADSLTIKRGRQNKEINFADICMIQFS